MKEENRTAQGQPWAPSLSKDLSKSMAVLTKECLNRFLVYFLKVHIQNLIAQFQHKVGEMSPLHFISDSHFAVWQSPLWSFGVGNYVLSHCLISSVPGRKQQSIEPSCVPLSTLCTHRWTASDNAINSTCSETILSQETGNHPYRKKLSCTRKEILGAGRNCRRKNCAGWPSKMLPLCLPIHISQDFSHESELAYCRTSEFSWGSNTSSELFWLNEYITGGAEQQ